MAYESLPVFLVSVHRQGSVHSSEQEVEEIRRLLQRHAGDRGEDWSDAIHPCRQHASHRLVGRGRVNLQSRPRTGNVPNLAHISHYDTLCVTSYIESQFRLSYEFLIKYVTCQRHVTQYWQFNVMQTSREAHGVKKLKICHSPMKKSQRPDLKALVT